MRKVREGDFSNFRHGLEPFVATRKAVVAYVRTRADYRILG